MTPPFAAHSLEFYVQSPISDGLLNDILFALPLPSSLSPHLAKSILLRRIDTHLFTGSISEKTLHSLELIDEIDRYTNHPTSDRLKTAYCAVALKCTADHLDSGDDDFLDAVDRIWRNRIGDLLQSEQAAAKLASEELRAWKVKMERVVTDDGVWDEVLEWGENEGNWEEAVSAFLMTASNEMEEKGDVEPSEVEVQALEDEVPGELCQKSTVGDLLSSPEVREVRKALKESTEALKMVVEDPLPEAIAAADGVLADKLKGDCVNEEEDKEISDAQVKRFVDIQVDVGITFKSRDGNASSSKGPEGNQSDMGTDARVTRSLMDRNPTAKTYEWDDSIDSPPEKSPSPSGLPSRRPFLPSPTRTVISPLKLHEDKNLARRRKAKKWSTLEEDILREAVRKIGKGNWKRILSTYREVFKERTEVDLKDKWRNMTRSFP